MFHEKETYPQDFLRETKQNRRTEKGTKFV